MQYNIGCYYIQKSMNINPRININIFTLKINHPQSFRSNDSKKETHDFWYIR